MGLDCSSLWGTCCVSASYDAVHCTHTFCTATAHPWRRPPCRDMNAATSQEVFAGPYLTDPVKRQKFSDCFQDMTQGFLAFPLCIPGTAVWKGKQGRLWIIDLLEEAAGKSKAAMKVGSRLCCAAQQIALPENTDVGRQHSNTHGRPAGDRRESASELRVDMSGSGAASACCLQVWWQGTALHTCEVLSAATLRCSAWLAPVRHRLAHEPPLSWWLAISPMPEKSDRALQSLLPLQTSKQGRHLC